MSHSSIRPSSPSDLLRSVADRADCGATRADVRALLAAVASWMQQSLSTTGVFRVPGMFRVMLRSVPARPTLMGRNPRTGAIVVLAPRPARRVAKIKIDPVWQREVFAAMPVKEDPITRRVAVDHGRIHEGRLVPAGSAPRGLRRFVRAIAPLFPRLTQVQLATVFCALRDEVAERVILLGRCSLAGLATLRFHGRKEQGPRLAKNPFTGETVTLAGRPARGGCRGLVVKARRELGGVEASVATAA